MKLAAYVPTFPQISREALTVIAGALLAALIVSQLPPVKAYIRQAWQS
jgi:hypothetical protein